MYPVVPLQYKAFDFLTCAASSMGSGGFETRRCRIPRWRLQDTVRGWGLGFGVRSLGLGFGVWVYRGLGLGFREFRV